MPEDMGIKDEQDRIDAFSQWKWGKHTDNTKENMNIKATQCCPKPKER